MVLIDYEDLAFWTRSRPHTFGLKFDETASNQTKTLCFVVLNYSPISSISQCHRPVVTLEEEVMAEAEDEEAKEDKANKDKTASKAMILFHCPAMLAILGASAGTTNMPMRTNKVVIQLVTTLL
jgi:hypothetical protein